MHALFKCPRVVKEVWFHLGMEKTILDACNMELQGPSVLADLLLTQRGVALRLPEVTMVELIASTIWYVWWERCQATHGESVR